MSLSAKVMKTGLLGNQDRYIILKVTPANAPASYPTNGDTLDLSAVTNPNGLIGAYVTLPPAVEDINFMDSLAGALCEWVPGSTIKNALVKIWSSAGTEHANGNYTAAELADTVQLMIIIKKSH